MSTVGTNLGHRPFVRGHLIEWGDAEKTSHNIVDSAFLWRLQFAGNLVVYICDVSLAGIFYVLLRPVNEPIVLLAAFFHLVFASGRDRGWARRPCGSADIDGGRGIPACLQPAATACGGAISIQLREMAFVISNIFFGLNCVLLGYLLMRAAYFPSFLGVLLAIAGSCYVTNSFAWILFPDVAQHLAPWILLPRFARKSRRRLRAAWASAAAPQLHSASASLRDAHPANLYRQAHKYRYTPRRFDECFALTRAKIS